MNKYKDVKRAKLFIPAIRKCDAVYVWDDKLEREPIIGYVLFSTYECDAREGAITEEGLYKNIGDDSLYHSIHAVAAPEGESNLLDDYFPEEMENFLGYEYDGIEKDWTREIELKKAEQSKSKQTISGGGITQKENEL